MMSNIALLGVILSSANFNAESLKFVQQYFEQTGDPLCKMKL